MMQGWALYASALEQDPWMNVQRVSDGYIRREALKKGYISEEGTNVRQT